MNDRVSDFGSSASILRRSSAKHSGSLHCSKPALLRVPGARPGGTVGAGEAL